MRGEFPNPDNILRPGQYARVRAVTSTAKNALLVPQRAVAELQGVFQVAVVKADDTVELRVVEPGVLAGSDRVIEKGLTAGERIVVEGLQKVRPGTLVTSKAPAAAPPEAKADAAAPACRSPPRPAGERGGRSCRTRPRGGDFFIRRPIVAIVISIVTVLLGVVAMGRLPIAQYPDIVPPEIVVNATYTGADAITIEQSVATPIEQQVTASTT
jgi:hypothetical protein